MAVAVAVVALLVAVVSLAVAVRALDRAEDARNVVRAGRGGQTSPAALPTGRTPTTRPNGGGNAVGTAPAPTDTAEPTLDARTVYQVKYTKRQLTLTASGYDEMYADLDEPRANVDSSGYDVVLHGPSSGPVQTPFFELGDEVDGGQLDNPDATPQDCADRIQFAPVGTAKVPARQGLVLCLTTSKKAAKARGDVWRMVLVEVTGVTSDGSVTMLATAWNIPR